MLGYIDSRQLQVPSSIKNNVHISLFQYLHCHAHAGIFVPEQQRVLPIPHLRIFNIRPAIHEIFMSCDLRQLARYGTIDIFEHIEIGREEYIEVALVNLQICISWVQTSSQQH